MSARRQPDVALAVAAAERGVVIVARIGAYLLAGARGEILTVAAQARGVAGLLVVRDINSIAKRRFPVFSRGAAIGACTKERFGTLGEPIVFGRVIVRPGDIVLGNSDGIEVVAQPRAGEVFEAALGRRQREVVLMAELQKGRTTVDLLRLPPGGPGRKIAAR